MRDLRWTMVIPAALCLAACNDGAPGATEDPGQDSELAGNFPALGGDCGSLVDAETLRTYVRAAPDSVEVGGLFHGSREWAALVDRAGRPCALVSAEDSAGAVWPGSRTIALAKAYTANGFSTNSQPLSTARLYTMGQPGGSLYGAFVPNPFDPACMSGGEPAGPCGGTVIFGGGLPLYRDGRVVGGLGVSGDTPCADHEVAKQIRAMTGLVPPGGNHADEIVYGLEGPSPYTHPLCQNTWRNGEEIGDAPGVPPYPHDLPADVDPERGDTLSSAGDTALLSRAADPRAALRREPRAAPRASPRTPPRPRRPTHG